MHHYTHWLGDQNSRQKQKKIIKTILATILLSLALLVASASFSQETQAHVADENHGFAITPALSWEDDSMELTTQISDDHEYVANTTTDWAATVIVYRYIEGGEVACDYNLVRSGLNSYSLESTWLANGYSSNAFAEQNDILNRHDAIALTVASSIDNPPIQYEYSSTLNERSELTDYISGDKELGLCFVVISLDDSHVLFKNIVIDDFATLSYSEVGTSSDSSSGSGNNAGNQNADNSGDAFGTGDGGIGNSDAGSKPSESPDLGIADDINYVFYGFIVTAIILTFPVAQIVYKSNQNKKKDSGKA